MRTRFYITFLIVFSCTFISNGFAQENSSYKIFFSDKEADTSRIKAAQELCGLFSSNDPDSCILIADGAIKLSIKSNYKKQLPFFHKIKGVAYVNKSDYKKSLECYLEGLKNAEQQGNRKEIAAIYSNIGVNFWYQKEYRTALRYHRISLDQRIKLGDPKDISKSYNNIGTVEVELGNYQKALWHYKAALRIKDSLNDQVGIANCNNNIGIVYEKMHNYREAIKHYENALAEFLESEDVRGQVVCYNNIATGYKHLNDNSKAIEFASKALKLARELGDLEDVKMAFEIIAVCYRNLGNDKMAYDYLYRFTKLNDSLRNENIVQEIQEMEKKYQSVKQEQAINELENENKLKDLEINQHKTSRNYLMLIVILAIAIIALAAIGFVKIRKQKNILELNKIYIEEKNAILEDQKKEIIDSINYAKRIQYTLLAHKDFLNKHIPQHFIYFQPKDIVSGDFYWATNVSITKNENKFYLAVCDSTGHGVPGAFMSLLNIGFLTESINEKDIHEPHKAFDQVRTKLIDNLNKEGQKDGFDGILLCIHSNTNSKDVLKLTYAAANNAPVLIRGNNLIELEYDRMPVGIGERKDPFKLHSIDVLPGDQLYLFTDGYADQFGGPKGKKFKYKQLHEVLLKNASKPMEEQKQILANTFDNWRGNLEQVDDVCIIGIRL